MTKCLHMILSVTLLGYLLSGATASAQLVDKKTLTLEAAKKVAAAAEAEAVKNNWKVVIAVVDDGGHLVYLQRLDETQLGSIDVAVQKAYTAVTFKRPTKALEDAVLTGGRTVVLSLPRALPIEGGLPIIVDGKVVGGIGVSGVTAQQDGQIAKAGVEALPTILAGR
jgi:glc operon protein GlcG